MAENQEINENKRIKLLADRLAEEYVSEDGEPPHPDHVSEVVDIAAQPLADAPVQDFVPLLVENAARDRLHAEGLHVEPDEEDTAPPMKEDGEDTKRLVSGFGRADMEKR